MKPSITIPRRTNSTTAKLRALIDKSAKLKRHGFKNTQTHADFKCALPTINMLCYRVFGAGNYSITQKNVPGIYRVYYKG